MLQYIETTGKNEEEAINAALRKLGLDRDEVSVEVLERAKCGLLGIGGSPAKVKVTYEVPDEPAPKAAEPKVEEPKAEAPKAEAPKAQPVKVEVPSAPPIETAKPQPETGESAPAGDRAEAITAFLNGLMAHMGVSAVPRIAMGEDGSYKVTLEGENLGALIGRRGETLDAIQQLTSYAVNRGQSKRPQGGRKGGQVPPERDPGAHERLRAPCDPHRPPGLPRRDHLLHRHRAQPPHRGGLLQGRAPELRRT